MASAGKSCGKSAEYSITAKPLNIQLSPAASKELRCCSERLLQRKEDNLLVDVAVEFVCEVDKGIPNAGEQRDAHQCIRGGGRMALKSAARTAEKLVIEELPRCGLYGKVERVSATVVRACSSGG
jgi:hypothetical protein